MSREGSRTDSHRIRTSTSPSPVPIRVTTVRDSYRFEILVVTAIVTLTAVYVRAEYIPPYAERHVAIAAEKYDLEVGSPGPWFSAWSVGDGQAFAVIAADPTGKKLSQEIKEPAYRFSRAGYGWLAAAASFGQDRWIPYGMALVGGVALAGVLWITVSLRKSLGPRVWVLVLNPALYIGFAGDTAEPVAILALIYATTSGALWASAALGVTRPSYLIAILGNKRQFGTGIAAAVTLLLYSIIRFGTEELVPDGGRLDFPLRAFMENPSVAGWVLVALAGATAGVGLKWRDWAWVVSGLLVLSLGTDVTANVENAWRAAGMLPVLWALGPRYRQSQRENFQDLACKR